MLRIRPMHVFLGGRRHPSQPFFFNCLCLCDDGLLDSRVNARTTTTTTAVTTKKRSVPKTDMNLTPMVTDYRFDTDYR